MGFILLCILIAVAIYVGIWARPSVQTNIGSNSAENQSNSAVEETDASTEDECTNADGQPLPTVENPCMADAISARAAALSSDTDLPNQLTDDQLDDEPGVRKISCHELIGGQPNADQTIFALRGNDLYKNDFRISSTSLIKLSSGPDEHGEMEQSFAKHEVHDDVLVRTVFTKTGSGPLKLVFSERYDFSNQIVFDPTDGDDTCHHNRR